ncbi:hypothetical protein B0O99DRAFT_627629 [Bisporella sp. PMI_857]|nr:hypothetical protein B0O99DRAFT_627629 [Bisporella sp. PMI_857]
MDKPGTGTSLHQPPDINVNSNTMKSASAPTMAATMAEDYEESSSDDISMSSESDNEHEDTPGQPGTQTRQEEGTIDLPDRIASYEPARSASGKRKLSESMTDTPSSGSNETIPEVAKRQKPNGGRETVQFHRISNGCLHEDRSLLPAEIWHYIFTFIPPRTLGTLLCVNKTFRSCLDPSSPNRFISPLEQSATSILTPDGIWQASRRLYWPGMPAPLKGKTELDMWRMACSSVCQFCGKKQPAPAFQQDQWHPGPGNDGISPVWSYGVLSCGPCLEERTEKEITLLLSNDFPTRLLAALPLLYFSNELHIIPQSTIKQNSAPSTIRIVKIYFQPHILEIKQEYSEVQMLGPATADEWLKGLDERGIERRNDAARWEKWQISGGVASMRTASPELHESKYAGPSGNGIMPIPSIFLAQGNHPLSALQNYSSHVPTTQNFSQQPHGIQTSFPSPAQNQPRFDSPQQNGFGALTRTFPTPRQERSKEQVVELKAARRAEIERRCMLLDPPLTSSVLAHMSSFQAAMQIVKPFDDSAWEVLQPRLLSQRSDAETRENERLAQSQVVLEQTAIQPQGTQTWKTASENKDLEWDDALQAPLRARIGGYADETIRDGWGGGHKVSKDNSSVFAAQVLIYVRKRFYAEVAKDEAAVRATGKEPIMDPPNGPYTRKLTLENMKWVFDTKIKPHTEQYRKELFLCNDCEVSKFYGFEGVIQHYAAKHTNTLSLGSVVVHWKAEWPEYTPFNPEPPTGKASSYYSSQTPVPSASAPYSAPQLQAYSYGGYPPVAAPVPIQGHNQNGYHQPTAPTPIQMPNGYTTSVPVHTPGPHIYPQVAAPVLLQALNPSGYQQNTAPYYSQPQYGEAYTMHQNGPFGPPAAYPDSSQDYQAGQHSDPQITNSYSEPSHNYSQHSYGNQYISTSEGYYAGPASGEQYALTSNASYRGQQAPYIPAEDQYNYNYQQPPLSTQAAQSEHITTAAPAASETTTSEEYRSQLQDVVRNAGDVWDTINGLKDVPGSVKVFTIIHHIVKRSRFRFPEDPPLSMIIDGLSNNKDMRKVRNINGLQCKTCLLGSSGSSSTTQKKHFSFPQLVNHFHTFHEQITSSHTSWLRDMVELPDRSRLASIAAAPGMNDQRLKLIADALPEIFVPPQPKAEPSRVSPEIETWRGAKQYSYDLPASQDNHAKYYSVEESKAPDTAYENDENEQYDPRRPLDLRDSQAAEAIQSQQKILLRTEDSYSAYEDGPERFSADSRAISPASHVRRSNGQNRVSVHDEAPRYLERSFRHHDEPEFEYRVRREPLNLDYDSKSGRDYRIINSQTYQSNLHEVLSDSQNGPFREIYSLPVKDAAKQNHVFEVVAQISEQTRRTQERNLSNGELVHVGSEDGELRTISSSRPDKRQFEPTAETREAADRFLGHFVPDSNGREYIKHFVDAETRPIRRDDRQGDGLYRGHQSTLEPQKRGHDHDVDDRIIPSRRHMITNLPNDTVPKAYSHDSRRRSPEQPRRRTFDSDERYVGAEQVMPTKRSPGLADHRFNNDVVYRDEKPSSHGMQRTSSSRFARYASVRVDNDRARSRSPVYIKPGPQPDQYREPSPVIRVPPQETTYRTRSPVGAREITYDRASGQEYYRFYADESRRQPQYIETFEYVRVADHDGDYMIRRPVRRQVEPVYATYGSEPYERQPVYESRVPIIRPDPTYYEEEYDPRHPEPPPASTRQVRYH